mmetsp:Transcript_3521/g.7738  ORF Transcript_3521/g.7738 Transcript_3521/m.7738 type:complete len:112 (-) Transcript_3521:2361-2696(-)
MESPHNCIPVPQQTSFPCNRPRRIIQIETKRGTTTTPEGGAFTLPLPPTTTTWEPRGDAACAGSKITLPRAKLKPKPKHKPTPALPAPGPGLPQRARRAGHPNPGSIRSGA